MQTKPSKSQLNLLANKTTKPFLKWVGGKRQLLSELGRLSPKKYRTYYEPMLGGGALFFELDPPCAILGDLNERLVRTYRGIADSVEDVIQLLSSWPHDQKFFTKKRQEDTSGKSNMEIAAWFIYLNRTAFNGLYRVNRKNEFNVPFGKYANPTICDPEVLRACSARLSRGVTILHGDFETVASSAGEGDFVYFDPPYVPLSASSNFARYTSRVFSDSDQQRLRDFALVLKRRGVHVLISNSATDTTYKLYQEHFEIHTVGARRSVNAKGNSRGEVEEVLIR